MKKLKCLMLVAAVVLSLAGCKKSVEVSFGDATQEIAAQGGTVEVALKSNGEWTLNSSAEWLVVTPLSGNGDATLTLTAEPNQGETRTAEITAATKDNTAKLTVTQPALEYYITVTPKEIRCGNEGGEFDITVSSNIEWMVSTPQWITSSVTHGSNDGTVTLTVEAVNGDIGDLREVEVFFGNLVTNDKVHVTQNTAPELAIEVSPMSLNFDYPGETKTVAVTTEDAWTATTTADWIVLGTTEGSGNAEVSVTANENPEYTDRQATVVFATGGASATLIVRQEAAPDPHFLEADPLVFQFGKEGGQQYIHVGCDTDWEFSIACGWLSVTPQSGTGSMTVILTAEPNVVNESRTADFVVKSGPLSQELRASQEAGESPVAASFATDSLQVTYTGGLQTVHLSANTTWYLQASDWITLITTSGEGDASFDIAVSPNSNPETRFGFVNVVHNSSVLATLVVVQEGRVDILESDITEMTVRPEGGEFTIHITANQSWTLNTDVSWIHYSPESGFGNKDVTVTVDPMSGVRPRTGLLKVSGSSGAEVMITIVQQ